MKKEICTVEELLSAADSRLGWKVEVRGRLLVSMKAVLLKEPDSDASIVLDIEPTAIIKADKKCWMIVGGERLYDYLATVVGHLQQVLDASKAYRVCNVEKIVLHGRDGTNEIDFSAPASGSELKMIDV